MIVSCVAPCLTSCLGATQGVQGQEGALKFIMRREEGLSNVLVGGPEESTNVPSPQYAIHSPGGLSLSIYGGDAESARPQGEGGTEVGRRELS